MCLISGKISLVVDVIRTQGWRWKSLCKSDLYLLHGSFLYFLYKRHINSQVRIKEMENMYIEGAEVIPSTCSWLIWRACQCPKAASSSFQETQKRSHNASIIDMGEESENQLSKSDVVLSFSLEVKPKSWELPGRARPDWVIRCITINHSAFAPRSSY